MTWGEVCANRYLKDLPFRIETNRWGQIVLSPLHNNHSFAQSAVYNLLGQKMPRGTRLQCTVIDTDDGHKVAGATWMSEAFYAAHKRQSSFKQAPEICVEVNSPINSLGDSLPSFSRSEFTFPRPVSLSRAGFCTFRAVFRRFRATFSRPTA